MTRSIGVRDLKNRATKILRAVREEGSEYVVTVRGRPVAILRPITAEDGDRQRRERAEAFVAGLQAIADRAARSRGPAGATPFEQLLADRGGEP